MACKTPVKIDKSQAIGSETDSMMKISGITHTFLVDLLKQHPDHFQNVLANPDNKVQIIYTQIDRRKNGKPEFTDHYFNISDSSYFYPASTVKLPIAILALQKLLIADPSASRSRSLPTKRAMFIFTRAQGRSCGIHVRHRSSSRKPAADLPISSDSR